MKSVDRLTPREFETMKLLAVGKTSEEIAKILEISSHTVSTNASLIFAKTGCPNRVALAHWAIANKYVELMY